MSVFIGGGPRSVVAVADATLLRQTSYAGQAARVPPKKAFAEKDALQNYLRRSGGGDGRSITVAVRYMSRRFVLLSSPMKLGPKKLL